MISVDLIYAYFPELTAKQKEQFAQLKDLYEFWNNQINVISRKDMDSFYERHVLHSLAIAKVITFKKGTSILDIGTGGGFPGIPLAILFPDTQFHLVDSIGKKIKVVNEVALALGLTNVKATHERAENIKEKFDFIVSRAVTAMPEFLRWTKNKFNKENKNYLKNGILYLKGGDLTEEMKPVKEKINYHPIPKYFNEEFFETKKVVYLKMN
ncbi:MAG: 16S rRNA (guanine(527)-N(7))-methyltransferase RsmG [Flavobacteriia bacterium]|jgi:16S rRNA (guanine527-N7)-methyltransferase